MSTSIPVFKKIITCPYCEVSALLEGENESIHHLYRCHSCGAILKPKSGDCCIMCSFGNRDCSTSEHNLAA